jgi:hypothetical protein
MILLCLLCAIALYFMGYLTNIVTFLVGLFLLILERKWQRH